MAAPIRPNFTPVNPQLQNPANNQARSAAQRAFFEAALGKAQGQAAQPQPQASAQGSGQATRAAQTQTTQAAAPLRTASPAAARAAYVPKIPATLPAEPPTRILRPGSILDIKV
ncbi:hypothetical protein [Phenylobacterium conjunctum]|mgnify:CR=1 FL=1|uniref:Flagellar hook-length control protein FliK n=1 Tax=Phenylobacterium conjunctum TaxID=1298959 RepID=A0ABW3T1T3_9CAUL